MRRILTGCAALFFNRKAKGKIMNNTITARIKSVEYQKGDQTCIKFESLIQGEDQGKGSLVLHGRVSAEPGSEVDITIGISEPLQLDLSLAV